MKHLKTFENSKTEAEIWNQLYSEFEEKVVKPSKVDDVEFHLSYNNLDTPKKREIRNQYIRNKTLDFFKEKGFNLTWKALNVLLSWENYKFDLESNFDVAFDYMKGSITQNEPEQIYLTQSLKKLNNQTGVFENVTVDLLRSDSSVDKRSKLIRQNVYKIYIPVSIIRNLDLSEIVLTKIPNGFLIRRAGLNDINVKSIKNYLQIPSKMIEQEDLGTYELEIIDNDTIELTKI